MEAHGVLAAITSASAFLTSQHRIVTPDQFSSTNRSMLSSLVLQVNQLSELSSDDATMLTDAVDSSAFDTESKGALAAAIGAKMAAAGTRTMAGPKGQACLHIKDYTIWRCHSALDMHVYINTNISYTRTYTHSTHMHCVGNAPRTLLHTCI